MARADMRLDRVVTYAVALDNRDPWHKQHRQVHGPMEVWEPAADSVDQDPRLVLVGVLEWVKDAATAVYLVDDGATVRPFYVAGWSPLDNEKSPDTRGNVILAPFPVSVNADGSPRLRADDGRPVDYSTWALGPRRAYHLKVRP